MAKARHSGRDRFLWLLLQFSLVFGVANHYFDREKRQLIYSPGAFVYRVTMHVAAIIVVSVNVGQMMQDTSEMLQETRFTREVGFVCIYINMFVVFHSLFSEWTNHGKGTELFNKLLQVHIEDEAGDISIPKVTWNLLWLKSVSKFLVMLTFILTSFNQSYLTARMAVGITCFDILQLVHISIQYQFTVVMLYGGHLFKRLNHRLSLLVKDINKSLYLSRRRSQKLSEELIKLGRFHTTLLHLLTRIKDIYQFDILVVITALFTLQMCSIFFVIVTHNDSLQKVTPSMLLIASGNTLASTVDLLIILYICGDCVKACNTSGELLKELQPLRVVHASLDNDIDTLCFQLVREKMRLTICGIFDLDIDTGPAMIEGLLMKVILMTQIGYDDLH